MTKEQAINYLKSSGFSDEQIEAVSEALSEERKTEWHPYPQEKPTEEGYYLCTVTDCPYRVHTFWYIDAEDGFGERLNGWKITAWMPLPKPYEGSEE